MKATIDKAKEILDTAKNIYQFQERNNPNAIFRNKVFLEGTEENREAVSVEIDYEKTDSSYYFETPEIDGVIIKRKNGEFCVKACVKYNDRLWFAKIRIEHSFDGEIMIRGKWSGSWQDEDFYDEDQLTNPNSDFPIALESMRNHMANLYSLYQNVEPNSGVGEPSWVRKLKKYNN